jgi:molybdopterin-guanine dinucleotide biosynthesis protein A
MGREKHGEPVAGKSLIERVIERLRPLSTEILVVISQRQSKSSFASYPGTTTVEDLYAGGGPLGGIYSGIVHSNGFRNLAVACDMPFLNRDLLGYMLGLAPGFDIVMPRIGEYKEPLHAVYTKDCLPAMERLIEEGRLKIDGLVDLVRVRYVEREEIESYDPAHLSFFNINTRADLEKARKLASRQAAGERRGRAA